MSPEIGTTTITSAQALTGDYALADNALQIVSGSDKWLHLYAETQATLEISYTTGAAEADNYLEFYIQFGSGAPTLISWADETVEYMDDSASQMILERWTYRLDGAAAATSYTKRVNLPVCTKGVRIYVREVGVVANFGTITIKANIVAAGAAFYNRSLQTVSLEGGASSGVYVEDTEHANGDSGVAVLTKRTDAAAASAGTDGDYQTLNTDALGNLWVHEYYAPGAEDNSNNVIATQNKPLAVSTYAWSSDISAALEASTISKATPGVIRAATVRIDSTHATATYYIQFYNSATLPADGAVTFLCAPYKVQHVTGTDTTVSFDFTMNGLYASAGIVMALSTTEFTKTISGAFTSSTILYK